MAQRHRFHAEENNRANVELAAENLSLINERNALLSEVAQLREACKKALTCASLNSDVRALIVTALAGKKR